MKRDLMPDFVNKIFGELREVKFTYLFNFIVLEILVRSLGGYVLSYLFSNALISYGDDSINLDNFLGILSYPPSFLFLFAYVFVLTLFVFFEFSFLYTMTSGHGLRETFRKIGKIFIKRLIKPFNKDSLYAILYFIIFLPMSHFGFSSIITENFKIPDFVSGELMKSPLSKFSFIALVVFVIYLNLRLIFTIPYLTENKDFKSSMKKSLCLSRKVTLGLILSLVFTYSIFTFFSLIFASLFSLSFDIVDRLSKSLLLKSSFYSLLDIGKFVYISFIKMITMLGLSYYMNDGLNIYSYGKKAEKIRGILAGLILAFYFSSSFIYNSWKIENFPVNNKLKLVAHRGDVKNGVENSLEAIESAGLKGADYAELDLVMTKDDKFLVIHDDNLKRLAGLNKKVSQMTYDELIGKRISQGRFSSKISSLDEIVKTARDNNLKLFIELKLYGHEPENYVDLVIEKLRSLDIPKDSRVISLKLDVLDQLKEKAPEFTTGYIIPFHLGDFSEYPVDFYVIEDMVYNDIFVAWLKNQKKEIYVWTVNKESALLKYMQSGVDGIITDELDSFSVKKQDFFERISYLDKMRYYYNLK